ncbi:hypothetical protein ACF06V_38000 [Streptomyces bobili]
MTDTPRTPPPTATAPHERPFARDPAWWDREHSRAQLTGHLRDHT